MLDRELMLTCDTSHNESKYSEYILNINVPIEPLKPRVYKGDPNLPACEVCGRRFNQESLVKHQQVCETHCLLNTYDIM